mmetsp:Transcript_2008/g.4360  ORF Transcript_2008/g.4360 Transcript_2008/m.4360 type:complete len:331 (+) Transcript_2008:103-1095(+)
MSQKLSSLVTAIGETLTQEKEALINGQEELRQEREKLQAEIDAMTKDGIAEDEILELNVGGETLMVKRSTLLLAPEEGHLNAMFSGRWDNSLSRDTKDRIFLNITPYVFRVILSNLRALQLEDMPNKGRNLKIKPEFERELNAVCKYFGIFDPQTPTLINLIAMKACCCHNSVDDKNVVTHTATSNAHAAVVSKEKIEDGTYWKIKILTLKKNNWIYAGIVADETPVALSYCDSTSFGWAGNKQVYSKGTKGSNSSNHEGWNGWNSGDEAIFKLETTNLKMYHKRLNKLFTLPSLPIEMATSWRMHLNLYSTGDKVEILIPTDEEVSLID